MIIAEGKKPRFITQDRSNRRMHTTVFPIWILTIHYSIIVWKDGLEILLHFSYKAHENDEDFPKLVRKK